MAVLLVMVGWLVYSYFWPTPDQPIENLPEETPLTVVEPPPVQPPLQKQKTDGTVLFEQGKYEDAIEQLQDELSGRQVEDPARHLSYLAVCYDRLNKPAQALETWDKIITTNSASPYCAQAYFEKGRFDKDRTKRIEFFEKVVAGFPESSWAQAAGSELCDYYFDLLDPERAYKSRHFYSLALRGKLAQKDEKRIKESLSQLNQKLVFSTMPAPDSKIYVVKPGDTLWKISREFKVEAGSEDVNGKTVPGHIKRINGLKTGNIFPGDKIKIITGKSHLEVSKTNFTMKLYFNGDFIKEYSIAVGHPKENPTPVGTFHITGKTSYPPWTKRDEKGTEVIPYGDSRNVLGTRWMSFRENPRFGIHGTTDPKSIGQAVTNGCVRMYNRDVEELYDLIPEDTEIIISD